MKLKPEIKNSEEQVQARIWDLAEKIAASGWTRMDVIKYVKENYGLGDVQAKRYWIAANKVFIPDELDKYRESLFNKNIALLESIIKKALSSNNLKEANNAIKTLSSMLGYGGKQIEIKDGDKNQTITISFSD